MSERNHTVLVLDNEDHFRKLLRSVLKREGYEVLTAKDGREALELLRENDSISIITSDNKMPGMSGVEFLRKSMAVSPHSKRIMITSTFSEELKPYLDQPGFLFGFLCKPVSMSEIIETVRLAINIYQRKTQMAG
ncbi:MAG: response regulator [Nitrospinaceae bacterium]